MENGVPIDEVMKYVNTGALPGLLLAAWYWLKYVWPVQRKQRDDDILARQDDNRFRRIELRILICFMDHLKKEGYAIDVPDLTKEL